MVQIFFIFFDGDVCDYDVGVIFVDVVKFILIFLVKKVIFVIVDGVYWDMQWLIEVDVKIVINIIKDNDVEVLEFICYDCVYIMVCVV